MHCGRDTFARTGICEACSGYDSPSQAAQPERSVSHELGADDFSEESSPDSVLDTGVEEGVKFYRETR